MEEANYSAKYNELQIINTVPFTRLTMLDGKWRFAFTTAESHEQEVGKLRSCFTLFITTSAILSYYLRLMIDFQAVERKKLVEPPSKIGLEPLCAMNNVIILHETGILPLSCCKFCPGSTVLSFSITLDDMSSESWNIICQPFDSVNFEDARRGL
ncbi:hypothetical protein WN944_003974 [Citrus x changshan-huyou]|uniref:Uncharacterized protein n=1 Tax=Citrus x changshan-huyou TaxID=2935761 RepID=A0AAP0LZJ4_9ROSI